MINFRLCVLLLLVVVLGKSLRAQEAGGGQRSQHAYNPFCNSAIDQYKGINQQIKTLLEDTLNQANSLNQSKALNTIILGIDSLNTNHESAQSRINKDANINQYKNLLATSLLWESVNMLTKPEPSDSSSAQAYSLEDLCKLPQNNSSAICKLSASKELGVHLAKLDEHIKNFSTAQSKLDPKALEDINEYAQKIFATVNTEASIGTLQSIVAKSASHDSARAIKECLVKDDKCSSELISKNSGLSDLFKEVSSKLTEHRQNSTPQQPLIDALQNKISNSLELVKKNEALESSSALKAPLEILRSKCQDASSIKLNYAACNETIANLSTALKSMEGQSTIKSQDERFRQKMSELKTVEFYEKLKHYLSNKYQRECSTTGIKSLQEDSGICIECEREMYQNIIAKSKGETELDELSQQIAPILGRLDSQLQSVTKSASPMDKRELAQYHDMCKNTSLNSQNGTSAQKICNEIASDYYRVRDVMDAQDWSEFQRKNVVNYDPKEKGNYVAYERKGNMRIFAEGLVQSNVTGKILNMWMTNMQFDYQVDMLTQQALMEKQFMYMNDPNSPWMINYPYFQTNFYNTPSTTGFNFGQ